VNPLLRPREGRTAAPFEGGDEQSQERDEVEATQDNDNRGAIFLKEKLYMSVRSMVFLVDVKMRRGVA